MCVCLRFMPGDILFWSTEVNVEVSWWVHLGFPRKASARSVSVYVV